MTAPHFSDFFELPLVGILRGVRSEHLSKVVNAARRGGLRYLEITMNSPGAEEQIRAATEISEGALLIGAGTVTSPSLLKRALAAGATFIITPTLNKEVIQRCEDAGVPMFPGALSPNEILSATELAPNHCPAVKLFPADTVGVGYIEAIKEQYPNVRLMPTGGVEIETLSTFLEAGADAFGIGSPLFPRNRIDAMDWNWLESKAKAFVKTYQSCVATLRAAKT